ncbi:FliH/SctL family protein [Endozoicomonas lisbonensis]|uniref:Flagellar assembly protein FliH n=1 Tax=Endozoicomonas lisbonensis TaxID=3120522 RepID=A0ABV2SCS0_9GAMM
MNSNEHVRPFAFPGPGQTLKQTASDDQKERELSVFTGRSRRRQQDSSGNGGSGRKRLRQLVGGGQISPGQPESEQSGKTDLLPAFSLSAKGGKASDDGRLHRRGRRAQVGEVSTEVDAEPESDATELEYDSVDLTPADKAGGKSVISDEQDIVTAVAESADTSPGSETVQSQNSDDTSQAEIDSVAEPAEKGVSVDASGPDSKTQNLNEAINSSPAATGSLQTSVDTQKEVPSAAATLQKALDDRFQKGLEQGRQEALQKQAEGFHQQAFEQGVESGREAGFQEGLQQGLAAAADELNQRFSGIEALMQAMDEHRRLLSHQQVLGAARLLERLVIEVVRTELRHSPEQIRAVVEEAVHLLDRTEHESISLRVNPDDAAWLQGFVENSADAFVIRPDSAVTRGGCRIEGRLGHVDATLEERLTDCIEQLRTGLLEDPQEAPPIDISPVYDIAKPVSVAAFPEPELPTARLTEVAAKPADNVKDSFFESGSSGLGAWGDLGQ